MCDNPGDCDVIDAKYINDEAEKSKIYFINPIKHDETWSTENSDNRRSDYVNVDVCRIFNKYEQPKASTSGKEFESIDSDPAHRAKLNQSLRNSD